MFNFDSGNNLEKSYYTLPVAVYKSSATVIKGLDGREYVVVAGNNSTTILLIYFDDSGNI